MTALRASIEPNSLAADGYLIEGLNEVRNSVVSVRHTHFRAILLSAFFHPSGRHTTLWTPRHSLDMSNFEHGDVRINGMPFRSGHDELTCAASGELSGTQMGGLHCRPWPQTPNVSSAVFSLRGEVTNEG